MKYTTILILALILIIIGMGISLTQCNKPVPPPYIPHTYKTINKDSQEITTSSVLLTTYNTLKKSNDSTLKELKIVTNKYTTTAILLKNYTEGGGKYKPVVSKGDSTIKVDTNKHITTITVYPIYTLNTKSKWDSINIVAKKDTIQFQYKVFNDFQLHIERYKDSCNVSVLNKNPNTVTTKLQSFNILFPVEKGNRFKFFCIGGATVLTGELLYVILHK